jgi:hypothetical protein
MILHTSWTQAAAAAQKHISRKGGFISRINCAQFSNTTVLTTTWVIPVWMTLQVRMFCHIEISAAYQDTATAACHCYRL